MGDRRQILATTLVACSLLLETGCLYEYRCVNGAVRVDGRCVFLEDGGPDASADAGDAARATDAGDAGASHDASPDDASTCETTMCDGDCVDTLTDERHCGECGNTCGTDLRCQNGSCIDPIVDVQAGDQHTCALRATGSILCWGDNRAGELGDGTTTERHVLTPVMGITDAAQVATGGFSFSASKAFTCARRRGGQVLCWGNNDWGMLGDGTTDARPVPEPVTGLTDAVDVSTGVRHACAVRAGGAIYCWGSNERGQLGNGATSTDPVVEPVPVSGISNAVMVSAGLWHSCAVLDDGSMRCWGAGDKGQLGENRTVDRSSPVEVAGIDNAMAVVAGLDFTCALRGAGAVECWGSNQYGNLGRETTSDVEPLPFGITSRRDYTRIDGAYYRTCGVRATGEVQCWGAESHGTGGLTTFLPTPQPHFDAPLDVASGSAHDCVVTEDGGVACIGDNFWGQLGDGTTENRDEPVMAEGLP